jgi:hypothetical protein
VLIKDVFWLKNELGFAVGLIITLIFVYTFFLKKKSLILNKDRINVILYITFSFVFIWICSVFHDVSFLTSIQFYRQLIIPLSLFLIFSTIRENITLEQFRKYFVLVIIIEFLLSLLQYQNLAPEFLTQKDLNIERLFHGTFSNNNFIGNFFALFALVLYFELIEKSFLELSKLKFYSLLSMTLLGVILSGVRTSFLALIAGIILANLMIPGKRKLVLIASLGGLIFINSLSNLKTFFSVDNSFTRIIEGVEILTTETDLKNSKSTISLSLRLFDAFNDGNFWIGQGKLFKGGYFVVDSGSTTKEISIENKNETDATLMVILVEFGVIGLSIFLLPAIWIFNITKNKRKSFVFLVTLLLMTITDLGIYYSLNVFIVLFYLKTTKSHQFKKDKYSILKDSIL